MKKPSYHIAYITASHLDLFWLGHLFSCLDRGTRVIKQYIDDCIEHPEKTYFIETVIFADEFVRRFPDYRERLTQLIRDGRVEVGAAFVDRIENWTSGESMIRHLAIGKRMLREMFGYTSQVCLHPDLPGYVPQLPQIYSKAGVGHYLTSRKGFPNGQVFRFKAPDGSTTLHCHFMFHYGFTPIGKVVDRLDEVDAGFPAGRIVAPGGGSDLIGRDSIVDPEFPAFFGFDGRQLEDHIAQARAQYPFLEFSYATLISVMSDYHDRDLPVRAGEAPSNWGSLASANVALTDGNGAAESSMLDAELLGALAGAFLAVPPVPAERGDWFGWRDRWPWIYLPRHKIAAGSEFSELWKMVLIPQDHNDGSWEGPESTYQKLQMHKRMTQYTDVIKRQCMGAIAGRVRPARDKGKPVIVFNQASWERTDFACLAGLDGTQVVITDEHGTTMPSQADGGEVWFWAQGVPSVGYKTLYVRHATPGCLAPPPNDAFESSSSVLTVRNERLRVEFDKKDGCIKRIESRDCGTPVGPPVEFGWGHVFALTEKGYDCAPKIDGTVPPERIQVKDVSIASSGPLFTEVLVRGSLCDSLVEQRWRIHHLTPRIDLDMRLLWWGKAKQQVRLALPVCEDFNEITYETPFYVNKWPQVMEGSGPWRGDEMSRDEWQRYREPIGWIDLSSRSGGVNIASRHSHYYVDSTNLQAVLLRSAVNCGDPDRYTTNAGEQKWKFMFTFHEGGWHKSYHKGFELARPLLVTYPGNEGTGDLPQTGSFISLEPSNLMISAIKSPDQGNPMELVVRFCEMEGRPCVAALRVTGALANAVETNLLEEDVRALDVANTNVVHMPVRPYEIRTLRLTLRGMP